MINYLNEMYNDSYYPDFLVDKIKEEILKFEFYLKNKNISINDIQKKLDEMTLSINNIEEEFNQNQSEIETVARESICDTVFLILKKYNVKIDIEEALRLREW